MNAQAALPVDKPDVIDGTVKWFDSTKLFGFVTATGFAGDFLLHRNVLYTFGRTSIANGSAISFRYEQSETGLRITEVISIDAPSDFAAPDAAFEPDTIDENRVPARVKWFDAKKGYGFVNRFGDRNDIFVGINVLKQSGMDELKTGDAVCVQVGETEGRLSVYRIHDWT